jgi:NAD(P)-dependent dehydrogenase (short-subunit alcohol dehydrogenase family)|tara:strand:- start:386 stop:1225 length:840 start_codon:yes stop_codon:yes gene_type:complete
MNNKLENLFNLDGKIIVITGACGLLGQKHAEAIAAFGGTPVLLDLSQQDIDKVSIKIQNEYSVNASGLAVDITNEDEVARSSSWAIEKYGKIDGLVNNAANNPKVEKNRTKQFSRLENFPLDLWNTDIAVGLTGSFLCAKYYGNLISQNPNGGTIINISSDLGLIAPDQRLYKKPGDSESQQQPVKPITYSVIKSGLIGLTRYLSTYWNSNNVRSNAICPGGVENGQSEVFLKEVITRIPMGRLAQANEYQSTLIWMLSDESSYLNGSIVAVDGGRTAW